MLNRKDIKSVHVFLLPIKELNFIKEFIKSLFNNNATEAQLADLLHYWLVL